MSGQMGKILTIARRDFRAILFSRSFLFFILGPLFPVVVAWMAGGIGASVQGAAGQPRIGVAMADADATRLIDARADLSQPLPGLPPLVQIDPIDGKDRAAVNRALQIGNGDYTIAAVVTGTLEAPELHGPMPRIGAWSGQVSLLVEHARALEYDDLGSPPVATVWPDIALDSVAQPTRIDEASGRIRTAQAGQTLLFLLTMLLAGMVLSNLVEEKANKIIEVLAAAVPMDSVFFGKLLAMLGVSFVGISIWGGVAAIAILAGGGPVGFLSTPAVGWPLFIALGAIYFACAYLLLGSLFLTIGGLAATVREVQTLSMPVTMAQLLVFFLASYALGHKGEPVELVAAIFPFSSPFAMLARAATDGALWPHLLAIGWQALWVVIIVRTGAILFRRTVMKSGPRGTKRGLFKMLRQSGRSFRQA